ncbi:sigma-54-dependent Fis family transcriptional regulator [Hansschlegelia sp.]|uniref:sigma-54-dependent Fis family transcriptional regulator n=1 Tax=Hansschlegelia sp. TaxID=2041892 RepID=UPI002CB20BE1|nr:sigma-54-dependent Fis family transcriptional regulator [Hansschlegelia sp.]HVI29577.1 sigma-54-dependent Fis family transcriptional regulator [Hansschlegelia sp.]
MSAAAPRADLMQARRDFFDRHAEPMDVVPPSILRSWRRCVERGFDSHAEPRIEPVGSAALREHHERNDRLIRLCRPELEALAAEARDTGSLVILTDGGGLVLDAVGDPGFAGKAAGVALRPGVRWAEASTGTNAIGAALVERRPIEVRGAEHYFESHRILTCAAAPIFDPRGALVGALDLSGAATIPHLHALSLIRLGVDQIEHRMFAEGFAGCDVLRLHADPALLGTPQEGVAVFEGARLVAANRHALKLLGLDWNALGARTFGDLFDGGHLARAEARTLRSRAGTVLHARLPAPAPLVPGARLKPAAPPAAPAGPVFDAATRANLARAVKLVDGDIPILIQGETGSGKEMFARAVHAASARAEKPFVAVNCAALPEGLIESELFGYEHGAFTGARRTGSKGLLREADGGVLFLDEIGDMPLPLQARLLRVVQERAVTPLGGGRPTPLDVRLICATHRDLQALSAQQAFRPDLYFRLAQFTFALPPLRALPDRTALIEALWRGLATEGRRFSPAAIAAMRRYDWPGNHRELVGVLKAMIALSSPGESLGPDLLPASVLQGAAPPATPAEAAAGGLDAMARGAMLAAVEACGGNVAAAARRLGVSRSTLYRRALSRRS